MEAHADDGITVLLLLVLKVSVSVEDGPELTGDLRAGLPRTERARHDVRKRLEKRILNSVPSSKGR